MFGFNRTAPLPNTNIEVTITTASIESQFDHTRQKSAKIPKGKAVERRYRTGEQEDDS